MEKILKDRTGVGEVEYIKTEYFSNNKLKIAAMIQFDHEEISENILKELESDIALAVKDPVHQRRLTKLSKKAIVKVLSYTTEIIEDIEKDITKEFPYITQIDLEQSMGNISKEYAGLIPLSSDEEDEEKK